MPDLPETEIGLMGYNAESLRRIADALQNLVKVTQKQVDVLENIAAHQEFIAGETQDISHALKTK